MEMESSRRSSMDRSRELPGLKKPRLSDDAQDRDRAANGVGVSSRVSSGNQAASQRFRANERERDEREDSVRGGGSSSSTTVSSIQQQQELVAQYKTALAELTFNSKPIITNLTIIAGENLHAAKGIAATICNNVLEVPSEQKLPSLYLLDSIVKNIGRDYIKYFAARLPEVFCKAYKQVDSSIHPGMRHLFGTWKGVFPPAPLQHIEKELGFPSVVNGSSGTTTTRSDTQTQRPAHSIHVNPKYLEARQRLQQTRAKEMSSDSGADAVALVEDAERSDRPSVTGSTRQWMDLSSKIPNMQRPQKEITNDPIYQKKGLKDVKDHQFSSIVSQQPDIGVGRASERSKERDNIDKSFFGPGGAASETAISRRNGFDATHSFGNYRTSGLAQADRQLPLIHDNNTSKSVQPAARSWKNSEEEEYMWDDMGSKSIDYGGTNSSTKRSWIVDKVDKDANLQRGQWAVIKSEQTDTHRDRLDTFQRLKSSVGEDRVPLFRDIDDSHLRPHSQRGADPRRKVETSADPRSVGRAPSGHHTWLQHEPLLPVPGLSQPSSRFGGQPETGGLPLNSSSPSHLIPPLPRPGIMSHSHSSTLGPSANITSGGTFGQQRQQPLQPPSPSHPSSPFQPLQHQKFPSAIDHDHSQPSYSQMGQKPIQLPAHLNRTSLTSVSQDSSPSLPENQSQQSYRHHLNIPSSQSSQSASTFTQLRHQSTFLHQSQPELPQAQTLSKLLTIAEKPQISQASGTRQSHRSSDNVSSTRPADVSEQSTSDLLAAIMRSGLLQNNPPSGLQNVKIQPPLPSGPPPVQILASSGSMVSPAALPIHAPQGNAPGPPGPLTGFVSPPLPPGPPPSSSVLSTSSHNSGAAGATANPFSSLLSSLVAKGIISSPATETPISSSVQLPSEVPDQVVEISRRSSLHVSSTSDDSTIPSSVKRSSILEQSSSTGMSLLATNATELEDLLGIDFKPEIIREHHPSVISSLFDDLKHQCGTCGLRFELQEQLCTHSDVHAPEKSETRSSDEVSRKWYPSTSNWVAGNMDAPHGQVPESSVEDVALAREECGPMVPADETQSICALCGEPFEDFYSFERDEWMYKGTVYLNSSERKSDMGSIDEVQDKVPIVHAKCISIPGDGKDMAENETMDWADG